SLLVLALMGSSKSLNPQGASAPNVAFAPPAIEDVSPARSPYTMIIGQGFAGVPVGPAHKDPSYRPELKKKGGEAPEDGSPTPAGVVRMNYLLPFEIVSVHLLVVLIGAAYLARAKRREEQARPEGGPS